MAAFPAIGADSVIPVLRKDLTEHSRSPVIDRFKGDFNSELRKPFVEVAA